MSAATRPCDGCGRDALPEQLATRWVAADLGLTTARCHDAPGCWAAALAQLGGRFVVLGPAKDARERLRSAREQAAADALKASASAADE